MLLHEALGHAVTALLLGGHVERLSVSLFGGGRVWASGIPGAGPAALLFDLSGIGVNALLGVVLLSLAGRLRDRPGAAPYILALGAAVNLLGATHYAVLGAFYRFGDPAAAPWLWPPALAALLLTVPAAFWLWGRTLPLGSGGWGAGLLVVLVPMSAYGAAYRAERAVSGGRTELVALAAEGADLERRREEAVAERAEQWSASHPGEPPPPEVLAEAARDVERPFPMTALVLGFDMLLFLLTLALRRRAGGADPDAPVPVAAPMWLAGALLLACLALQ